MDDLPVYDICEYYTNFLKYTNAVEKSLETPSENLKRFVKDMIEKIQIFNLLLEKMKHDDEVNISGVNELHNFKNSFLLTKNYVKYHLRIIRKDIHSIFQNYLDILQNEVLIDQKQNLDVFDFVFHNFFQK